MIYTRALIVLALVSSTFAHAASWGPSADVPGPFVPAPEQNALFSDFLGDYTCQADFPAVKELGFPVHKGTAVAKATMDLSGMWFHLRYVETATSENPQPYSFEEFWAFNPTDNTIDRIFMGSMGDRGTAVSVDAAQYKDTHSISWNGTLRINPVGVVFTVRDKVVVDSAGGFTFAGEILIPGTTLWVPQYTISCAKN